MLPKIVTALSSPIRPLRYSIDELTYQMMCDHSVLQPLRDRYKGKPMIIIGNGPSLNNTPLDQFSHVPSIGLNKIDLLYHRTTWRPEFILCTNDMVVRQHWKTWLDVGIPTYLSWKSRWHIPSRERKRFNYFLTKRDFSFDGSVTHGVGAGHTVTYAALQFAYFCGADPVILFGVDHSFVQEGKPGTYGRQSGPDVNHFDPKYFSSGSLWGLANLEQSEVDYRRARVAYEAAGRRILDATVDGKLQVFEKISLEEALRITSSEAGRSGADIG